MIHKLTWLIILVLGIFNLALADTVGLISSMPFNPVKHNSTINSVAFSPDGHYVLSGSSDNNIKLW
jgi:WD40 repeat protein